MHGKFEAILNPSGAVQFREPVRVSAPTKIVVTVLPEGMDAEQYEEVMRYVGSPASQADAERALTARREGKCMNTEEAIRYFEKLIGESNR